MSTLHTVNKSPYSNNTLASCIKVCGCKDAILLLEDGVFGALQNAPCAEELQQLIAGGVKVFVLDVDVQARGLMETLAEHITLTSYSDFVQLSLTHRSVQSWY